MADSNDVTAILKAVSTGESPAEELFPLVYGELRRLAATHLRDERPDHTLQPTALVHEAYLRLIDATRMDWRDRAHFMAIASQAIRRILVDYARRRSAEKRGGGAEHLQLDEAIEVPIHEADQRVLDLDEALQALALKHPEHAKVVQLRFFGGLSLEETAEVLELGRRTVDRYWFYARSWLYRYTTTGDGEVNRDADSVS